MKYAISIKKSAAKSLELLPLKMIKPITNAIIALSEVPRPKGCKKLKGKQSELWRIRVGDYRIIYDINDQIRIIDIMEVGHRRDIYD